MEGCLGLTMAGRQATAGRDNVLCLRRTLKHDGLPMPKALTTNERLHPKKVRNQGMNITLSQIQGLAI